MEKVRVTLAVATLLNAFLEDPSRPRYGYDLMRTTGYPSGKLYPVLARLEAAGWLVRQVENVDPATVGRPVRRNYTLSRDGLVAARAELARVNAQLAPGSGGRVPGAPGASSARGASSVPGASGTPIAPAAASGASAVPGVPGAVVTVTRRARSARAAARSDGAHSARKAA